MSIYDGFTTEGVAITEGLPVGKYLVKISDEAVVEAKTPEKAFTNPKYIQFTYEVLDGEQKGQTKKEIFNIYNIDDKTKIIAQKTLARIAKATGDIPINDMSPAKGRVMVIEIRQQVKNPQYTEVCGYYPKDTPIPVAVIEGL